MDLEQKLLFRAAARIHEGLRKRRSNPQWSLPKADWDELVLLAGQIGTARQRGWNRAAASRTEDMAFATDSVRHRLTTLSNELRMQATAERLATVADIYRDLLSLQDEFKEVSSDLAEHELRVTTAPIELEGIDLGPFQIRLDCEKLASSPAYRVVALDANPCSHREEVTHPHVCDEHLCEGEGTTAIRSALDQGRIGDFFLIILNLLRTYSPGHAYVELEDWNGSPCSVCGCCTTPDSARYCDSCSSNVCDECTTNCNSCDYVFCTDCMPKCARCEDWCCSSCLEPCSDCNAEVCPQCLEGDRCKTCHQEQQSLESPNEGPSQPTICNTRGEPAAAVQPDGLGQTAVSPRPRDERGRWVRRVAA
jgi:hypothetical protein